MKKITRFRDIPKFTRDGSYQVDMSPDYVIERVCGDWVDELGLDLNPDFQRGHVWTTDQQIAFIEYFMRGGKSGRLLYFNHPGWHGCYEGDFVLVDGKQRIEAFRRFLCNEIPMFGSYFYEYTDKIPFIESTFLVNVNSLQTRAEVLQWYIDMNTGGIVHTPKEIEKVKRLLEEELKKTK